MVDSVTAIDIAIRGPSLLGIGIVIIFATWLYCKVRDLIFGDK